MTRNKKSQKRQGDPLTKLRPAYPGQPVLQCWIAADPSKLTTTVTTGQIASSFTLSPTTTITGWGTRFGATWDEWRVIAIEASVRCFSSTNPGVISHWLEEKSATVPALAECEAAHALRFPAGDVFSPHTRLYHLHDPLDLEYTAIGTAKTVGYINVFTDNANYGSSAVATDYCSLQVRYLCQFRGFRS